MKFDFTKIEEMNKEKEIQKEVRPVNLKLSKKPYSEFKENIKIFSNLTQRDIFELMIKQFNEFCENKKNK